MKKTSKISKLNESDIKSAIIKRALGYDATEVVEEYSSNDEGVKLVKRKVTTKAVPPDLSAIKMLLDDNQSNLASLSDEQLHAEKLRLLSLLSKNI